MNNKKDDKFITTNADHSVTIKLEYPIKFEGENIEHITIRRAKYKEVKHSRTLEQENVLDYFLSTLSDKPTELFDEMDHTDVARMNKAVMDFLGVSID